jgi:hypothetical protein
VGALPPKLDGPALRLSRVGFSGLPRPAPYRPNGPAPLGVSSLHVGVSSLHVGELSFRACESPDAAVLRGPSPDRRFARAACRQPRHLALPRPAAAARVLITRLSPHRIDSEGQQVRDQHQRARKAPPAVTASTKCGCRTRRARPAASPRREPAASPRHDQVLSPTHPRRLTPASTGRISRRRPTASRMRSPALGSA